MGGVEIGGRDEGDLAFIEGEVDGIDGDGGDGVVGAIVGSGFVDWEELEEADVVIGGPVDPLAEGEGIADAEVSGASRRECGEQDAGGAFSSGLHGAGMLAGC
jgi:hypothetical protein